MRKKLGSEALGCPLPCPPFRCWGLKEGPLRKAGTRKRCGLDTPPSQTLGGGGGAWYGGPAGAERGRGVGAGALPPREGGPGQVHAGRGQALSPPRSCGDPTPVSGGGWRPADARGVGGWGGRGRGGEEKTHNKTCVAELTARLEWKEPAPAERSGDSGQRGLPAGRGGARGRSRYPARAAARGLGGRGRAWAEDSDFPAGSGRLPQPPRRGRRTCPVGGSGVQSARPRAPPRPCDPSTIATRAGAFSHPHPEADPGPRPPPRCAHLERI